MSATMDVFVSYAHADQAWVHTLADNLHQSGLEVWIDRWRIGAGDRWVHAIEQGLLNSRHGILVVTPTALEKPWVQEEYEVMVRHAVEHDRRLIPVLYQDATLPEFLANRQWVDFRGVDGPSYFAKLAELVQALKGETPGPPPRTGELKGPPGSQLRPEGRLTATLRLEGGTTTLAGDFGVVEGTHAGLDGALEQLLWQHDRTLQGTPGVLLRGEGAAGAETALADLGRKLGEAFLPEAVAAKLVERVERARQLNVSLELALEIEDPALRALPFEAMAPPAPGAGPLALDPSVNVFRRIPREDPATAIRIAGPLRILVAIGSPEAHNPRGELLDMEAELKRILDAVEPARRQGKAFVRILERGSVAAIREALGEQRYHALYVSCHARPGELILEGADGQEDEVSAKRFWEEALIRDRGVPLVILAGCSTALPGRSQDVVGTAEEPLPAFARTLVEHGVPAVLATLAPVSDRYATKLAGELLSTLATGQEPELLPAFAAVKRELETRRLAEARQRAGQTRADGRPEPGPEWSTPSLYAATRPQPLFDPSAPFEVVAQPAEPVLDKGVVVWRVGDFVGRRREERLMLRALRGNDAAGVVLHGIGGVGKSSLAANVLHRLAGDGWLVASLSGVVDNDRLLDELGARLLDHCRALKLAEDHERRQIANDLRVPNTAWEERLDQLIRHVLPQVPLVFLLDNFEDNLGAGRRVEGDLGELLASWIARPGRSRLLFTTRHPFELPEDAAEDLAALALGPLSLAETRKLALRLEGLAALKPEEFARAYEEVGGHPRALEYLDALLRGGKARFPEVEKRLKTALAKQGVDDPAGWRKAHAGKLDLAMADTVTLAANDVLLDDLLAELDAEPLAKRLLFGAAVYREPVDRTGLAWQVSTVVEQAEDPARQDRLERVAQAIQQAQASGQEPDVAAMGLSEADVMQYMHDQNAALAPPIEEPEGLDGAVARLQALSLLSPVQYADEEAARFLVHRWTAGALAQRAAPDALAEAHRRAAAYWRWRFDTLPQSKQQDIADLLEARHHHHTAGDLDGAVEATEWACTQLDTWGAWQWEERLCHETLGWLPERSQEAAVFVHTLGNLAYRRGEYDRALGWYRKSLEILEALGDRAGMASSYHQLGMVAQARGEYDRALGWYRKSLEILEALGDRAGMASSYHQLGMVAQARGEYDQALGWYRKSLEINEALGDRAGMARSYHQLGMVAELRGEYDQALGWTRKALEILEALGDRAGMARSYHQLGMVAQARGEYDRALGWYRKSLEIKEALGDRAGMASSYHNLGVVAQERGEYDQALDWYRKSLEINEALGDRAGMARSYHNLGVVAQERGEYDQALDWYRKSLEINEALGDRAGMARSYHQLGRVAQERGEYDQALGWTRKSLEINEALGDRAGMALSVGQIGNLYLSKGDAAEAVPFSLESLAVLAELQSPDAGNVLWSLADERAALGDARFSEIVRQHWDEESVAELLQALDEYAAEDEAGVDDGAAMSSDAEPR